MVNMDILSSLLTLNLGLSQSDNKKAFELMNLITPLNMKSYESGSEHNGWVVPHDWKVHKALIKKDGEIFFDGRIHPLAVAGYSSSFTGIVNKKELDTHVFFNKEFPTAYVFHCIYNYRPWVSHWGFCIPQYIYEKWIDGEYTIELETEYIKGEMLVGECLHNGEFENTILFNAHTCHPCQANDGFSGVLVILELFKWLKTQKTRYSYLGVLAPEHVGTVFYSKDLSQDRIKNIKAGCFMEMVGTDTKFALQQSFTGQSMIDKIAEYVLRLKEPELKIGAFRTIVGNDETVWEAAGLEIPTVSISRWPYKEYHTNLDNMDIMSSEKLEETLEILKSIIYILENDCTINRKFTGLVALSNPKYNLYVERPDPVVAKNLSPLDLRLGQMQDSLPRFFDGSHTIFQIAARFMIPFETLYQYLKKFEQKGLIELQPVTSFHVYDHK